MRRFRARCRERRSATLARRFIQSDAEHVYALAESAAWRVGGWNAVLARLSPPQAAALAVKLANDADTLRARAAELPASVSRAAQDRATVAAAVELLLATQPAELRPVIERLILRARDKRVLRFADGGGI